MSHTRWKTFRERKLTESYAESDDVAEARREIRLSMALAKAVHERRTDSVSPKPNSPSVPG